MAYRIDSTQQNIIIARLADFCRWNSRTSHHEHDAWDYMRSKLIEMKEPVLKLKQDQLMAATDIFATHLQKKQVDEKEIVEFKTAVHDYVSPNDFIDISFNLTPESLSNPVQKETAIRMMHQMQAVSLFAEEEKSERERLGQAKKLVAEMFQRLGLDVLDKVLAHKLRTPRRKRMVLRRIRKNVAEYCSVLHLSFNSQDTLSPFMLLRVEALLVACLRLLEKYRIGGMNHGNLDQK